VPRRTWVLLALLGSATVADPGHARDDPAAADAVVARGSGPLATRIEVQKLVMEERPDGEVVRQFVEADRLEAGEQIYYTVRVTNPGREPVTDVVVTKLMPYGVDYVPGSAVGPACKVEFSTDGGVSFVRPGRKGAYTHLRWVFARPLAPGATALLRFRAVFR
jgi:uncharacterized repeat protein (TIGR01451 family)